jgi:hypothetical protein
MARLKINDERKKRGIERNTNISEVKSEPQTNEIICEK